MRLANVRNCHRDVRAPPENEMLLFVTVPSFSLLQLSLNWPRLRGR
jgi:hypothetical protein